MAIADVDEIEADVHLTFHCSDKVSTAVTKMFSPCGGNSTKFHKYKKIKT
jgi:hypothetical protein